MNKIKLMIKVLTLLVFAGCHTLYAQELAWTGKAPFQNDKNLSRQNKTLQSALKELEREYKIKFSYRSDLIQDKLIKDTMFARQEGESISLQEKLTRLLKPLGLYFEENKNYYFIYSENDPNHLKEIKKRSSNLSTDADQSSSRSESVLLDRLLPSVYKVSKQEFPIKGKITSSENGDGLPGVNVVLKGTTVGTVTNSEGEYLLNLSDKTGTLIFSFIGFITQEVPINDRSEINISLAPDVKTLQEVIVVGYGTQEKKDVTGSVATVNSKQLQSVPLLSTEQALQGRTPGVLVTTNGGQPGGGINVMIRGVGTTGNNSPIYVIDGVVTGSGGTDNLGNSPLNLINPNDIESLTVLKDASAAAIYGASAANGVVLITTKRGKAGKTKVSLDAYYGMQKVWRTIDLMNSKDYSETVRAETLNSGKPYTAIPVNLRFPSLIKDDVDWQKEIYRTAPIRSYNLSLSGGSDAATFSLSGNWFKQEGTLLNTSFERRSIRVNSDFKVGKKIRIGESLTFSNTVSNRQINSGGRRTFEHTVKQGPNVPVYNSNKLGGFNSPSAADGHDTENPVLVNTLFQDRPKDYRALGNVYADLDIISGLTYRFFAGVDYTSNQGYSFNPTYEGIGTKVDSRASIFRGNGIGTQLTNTLTYNKTFNKHHIEALVGSERRYFGYESLNGSGTKLPNDGVISLGGSGTPGVSNSKSESALESIFGRINYSLADKYLLTFNLRRDGSSKLAKDNRFQVFPSFSAGWRLSEEAFMKNITWLSDLKIRGGYGELGNVNALGDYPFTVNLNGVANYNFNGTLSAGVTPTELSNPAIKWETSKTSNIGVDAGFLNGQILFTAEYYVKRTDGLQARDSRIAPSVGLSAPIINIGTVENRGWDFSATYRNTTGPFTYDFTGNLSTIHNELISLGDSGNAYVAVSYNTLVNVTRTKVGQSLGSFYGYKTNGIFQSDEELLSAPKQEGAQVGDRRIVDVNNDKKIDEKDKVDIGSPIPKFYYGFTANVAYKGFDLSLFFQGVQGNKVFNALRFWLENDNTNSNKGDAMLDRWTPFNTDATVPRAYNVQTAWDMSQNTDRYVENGSFLRLKNTTLGYSLGSNLLNKLGHLSKARVYVTAQNLITLTKYTGYDPELGELGANDANTVALTRGVDIGSYPQPRTFILGVQVGF